MNPPATLQIWCELRSRPSSGVAPSEITPSARNASVGIFALRDIPANTVVDRNVGMLDISPCLSHRLTSTIFAGSERRTNFVRICWADLVGNPVAYVVSPDVLDELRVRCVHNDEVLLPTYGLNVFRLVDYIKRADSGRQPNCVLREHPELIMRQLITVRQLARDEELLLAPDSVSALCPHLVPDFAPSPTGLQSVIHHLYKHVFCTLGASRFGVGVFAIQHIPRGTLLDHTLGQFDDEINSVCLTWQQLASLPTAVADHIRKLYQTDDNGVVFVPLYDAL